MENIDKITVFMPVYNGLLYLNETLDSLMNQTFDKFKLFIVDDGSDDGSVDLIQEFEKKYNRIIFHRSGKNVGSVPGLLKKYLPLIETDYFVYTSQDDIYSRDWLESMYEVAIDSNADATVPILEFYHGQKDNNNRRIVGYYGDVHCVISGREAFIASLDWSIPGNALWRMSIIKSIGVFDFAYNSDEYSVRVWYDACKKVAFSEGVFYYRQNNPNAITKKISSRFLYNYIQDLYLYNYVVNVGVESIIVNQRALALFSSIIYAHRMMAKYSFDDINKSNLKSEIKENTSDPYFYKRLIFSGPKGFVKALLLKVDFLIDVFCVLFPLKDK